MTDQAIGSDRLSSQTASPCTPYCAAGHFHSYPAIVVLWGSKAVPGHPGERSYTKLTAILTGQRPRHVPMTQTFPLPTSGHAA